jgi:hypothetical protein
MERSLLARGRSAERESPVGDDRVGRSAGKIGNSSNGGGCVTSVLRRLGTVEGLVLSIRLEPVAFVSAMEVFRLVASASVRFTDA